MPETQQLSNVERFNNLPYMWNMLESTIEDNATSMSENYLQSLLAMHGDPDAIQFWTESQLTRVCEAIQRTQSPLGRQMYEVTSEDVVRMRLTQPNLSSIDQIQGHRIDYIVFDESPSYLEELTTQQGEEEVPRAANPARPRQRRGSRSTSASSVPTAPIITQTSVSLSTSEQMTTELVTAMKAEEPVLFEHLTGSQIQDITRVADKLICKYIPIITRRAIFEDQMINSVEALLQEMQQLYDSGTGITGWNLQVSRVQNLVNTHLNDFYSYKEYLSTIRNRDREPYLTPKFIVKQVVYLFKQYSGSASSSTGTLWLKTDEVRITWEQDIIKLGPYQLAINLEQFDPQQFDYQNVYISTMDSTRVASNGLIHPHVSGGQVCPGNAVTGIRNSFGRAIRMGNFAMAIDQLATLLKFFNPGQEYGGGHIRNFISNQVCSACGSATAASDIMTCHVCNHRFCRSCSFYCSQCDQRSCKSCGTRDTANRTQYHCRCETSHSECCDCHGRFATTALDSYSGRCPDCLRIWLEGRMAGSRSNRTNRPADHISRSNSEVSPTFPRVENVPVAPRVSYNEAMGLTMEALVALQNGTGLTSEIPVASVPVDTVPEPVVTPNITNVSFQYGVSQTFWIYGEGLQNVSQIYFGNVMGILLSNRPSNSNRLLVRSPERFDPGYIKLEFEDGSRLLTNIRFTMRRPRAGRYQERLVPSCTYIPGPRALLRNDPVAETEDPFADTEVTTVPQRSVEQGESQETLSSRDIPDSRSGTSIFEEDGESLPTSITFEQAVGRAYRAASNVPSASSILVTDTEPDTSIPITRPYGHIGNRNRYREGTRGRWVTRE